MSTSRCHQTAQSKSIKYETCAIQIKGAGIDTSLGPRGLGHVGLSNTKWKVGTVLCDASTNSMTIFNLATGNKSSVKLTDIVKVHAKGNRCWIDHNKGFTIHLTEHKTKFNIFDCKDKIMAMVTGAENSSSESTPSMPTRRKSFTIKNDSYKEGIFQQSLAELYHSTDMWDVSVVVNGKVFHSHKVILSAFFDYFKVMFTTKLGSTGDTVTLNDISEEAFQNITDYIYKGEMNIKPEDCVATLKAIDMLQLNTLLKEAFIANLETNIHPENCLALSEFAELIGETKLSETSKMFAFKNLPLLMQTQAFLSLPVEDVITFLKDDRLCLAGEETVLDAVSEWINNDPANRQRHAASFIEQRCIRFCFFNPVSLFDKMTSNPPVMFEETDIKEHVDAAKRHQVIPTYEQEEHYWKCKPRRNQVKVMLFIPSKDMVPIPNRSQGLEWGVIRKPSFHNSPGDIFSACAVGQMLFCCVHREMWKYIMKEKTWKKCKDRLYSMKGCSLTYCANLVYAIGGTYSTDNIAADIMEVYNDKTNTWVRVQYMEDGKFVQSTLPYPVQSHATVAVGGHLYIIGGRLQNGCWSNHLQICESGKVAPGALMPKSQVNHRAIAYESKIFSIGDGMALAYDTVLQQWSTLSQPPDSLCGTRMWKFGMTLVGSKLLIVGGDRGEFDAAGNSKECLNETVYEYDPETDAYAYIRSLNQAVTLCAAFAVVKNDKLKWL